jgi:hypothetical protein
MLKFHVFIFSFLLQKGEVPDLSRTNTSLVSLVLRMFMEDL